MLLTLHTLPQLAVSAKLLCLLMVVICGAVPSMVRSVRLHNDCSSSSVRVDFRGHVLTGSNSDDDDPFQNLTLRSHGFGIISIQAVESSRFICFNKRWKLVGSKKFRGAMCQFLESMTPSGYIRYQSLANSEHFMGFSKRGHPINRTLASQPHRLKCFNFLKQDSDFNINKHNYQMSGGNSPQAAPPPRLPGDIGHRPRAPRPLEGRAKKVPGKNEQTVKLRHNHGNKNLSRKPS